MQTLSPHSLDHTRVVSNVRCVYSWVAAYCEGRRSDGPVGVFEECNEPANNSCVACVARELPYSCSSGYSHFAWHIAHSCNGVWVHFSILWPLQKRFTPDMVIAAHSVKLALDIIYIPKKRNSPHDALEIVSPSRKSITSGSHWRLIFGSTRAAETRSAIFPCEHNCCRAANTASGLIDSGVSTERRRLIVAMPCNHRGTCGAVGALWIRTPLSSILSASMATMSFWGRKLEQTWRGVREPLCSSIRTKTGNTTPFPTSLPLV